MKDLFVLTADADMQQVFRAILARPGMLGIRPVDAMVDRHPYRDSGVFKDGPEWLRATIPKNDYRRFLIAFDYEGSGCNKGPGEKCAALIQERMDSFTYKDCSATVVIEPELEEWLWCDPGAIASILDAQRDAILAIAGNPDEKFQTAFRRCQKRLPRPRDFELIAQRADLDSWARSSSFHFLRTTLQNWFPAT